jgi:EmrB/QacA subfamily drug resistance transporter
MDLGAGRDAVLSPRDRNRVLAVLFAGVLMGALDIAKLAPALKPIGIHFAVDARTLQWAFTVYVLMNVVGTPLMAKLSDLYGRRSIYVLAVAFFAIGSLAAGLAPAFEVLILGRALQGFGAGGIFPVASAVIGDTFPPEKRGTALGMIGAVWGIAFLLGPLVGLVLLGFGWQWIFLINLPIAAAVLVAGARILPAGRMAEGPVRFDWAGTALLALMLTSLTLAISQVNSEELLASLTTAPVLPALLLGLALVPLFWLVEVRAPEPVVRPDLLKRRQLVLADGLGFGTGLGEASIVFIPSLAVVLLGMSAQASSAMLMPVVLTMTVGTPAAGRLLDRVGSRVIVIGGGVLLAAGMLAMGLFARDMVGFILSGILIGAGLSSLAGAPVRYIVLNESGPQDRASAQAVLTVSRSMGQLLGAALLAALVASHDGAPQGYFAAYTAIGVVALAIAAAGGLLRGRSEERAVAGHAGPPTASKERSIPDRSAVLGTGHPHQER